MILRKHSSVWLQKRGRHNGKLFCTQYKGDPAGPHQHGLWPGVPHRPVTASDRHPSECSGGGLPRGAPHTGHRHVWIELRVPLLRHAHCQGPLHGISDPAPLLSPHGTGFHPGLYPAAPSHVPDSERGMLCDGLLSGPAARLDSPRGLSGPHPVQHLFYLPGSPVRLAFQRQAGGRHLRGIVDKYGGAPLGYMV